MFDILAITVPVYILIAIGYASTRWGLFSKADMRVLGRFVLNFALPALLFNSLAQRPLREVMHTDYLQAYALASFTVMVGALLWARAQSMTSPSAQSYFAMGMCSSNSGYMGYPILLLVIGPVAGVALALNMLVENLFILPLLMLLADRGPQHTGGTLRTLGRMLVSLLRTPMIAAIVVGFAFSFWDVHLPAPLSRTVTLLSQATSALALFAIGGTLVGLRIHGMRTRVAQIAMGKLVIHPLVTLLVALWVVPVVNPDLRTAAVLFAAMPMLGIYPLVAEKHGHQDVSAAALLVTTMLSFFTITALIAVLPHIAR